MHLLRLGFHAHFGWCRLSRRLRLLTLGRLERSSLVSAAASSCRLSGSCSAGFAAAEQAIEEPLFGGAHATTSPASR